MKDTNGNEVFTKNIKVYLTESEINFVKWLAKRDNITPAREFSQIFYTELNALVTLYYEEYKSETGV
ncbi:MAG: hypothetical protein IK122_02595 [Alphaproteobacteria bacterium]|nr:hypothetical protein [Alphaproteobacteria bacterium]